MLKTLFLAVSIPSLFAAPFVVYHYAPLIESQEKPPAPIAEQAPPIPLPQPQQSVPRPITFTLYVGLTTDAVSWIYWIQPSNEIGPPFGFCFVPVDANGLVLMDVNNLPIFAFIAANPSAAAVAKSRGY